MKKMNKVLSVVVLFFYLTQFPVVGAANEAQLRNISDEDFEKSEIYSDMEGLLRKVGSLTHTHMTGKLSRK